MFFNQAGLGPLAAVVATEIVDTSVRGVALGIASSATGLLSAVTHVPFAICPYACDFQPLSDCV